MARQITGTVTSDKTDKTIVITVRARRTHPLYKKQYTVNTKFMAHDQKNDAKVGDLVTIIETRPISARKRFRLERIIERGGVRFQETDATADIPEEAPAEETKPATKAKATVKKEDK
ncbi:30S ribosomal protein S17 [Candidatus Saccharibacteria bacterium]|nr:30S ribosomal protein S17 [Candidatus Saccharibacteria bacterium]